MKIVSDTHTRDVSWGAAVPRRRIGDVGSHYWSPSATKFNVHQQQTTQTRHPATDRNLAGFSQQGSRQICVFSPRNLEPIDFAWLREWWKKRKIKSSAQISNKIVSSKLHIWRACSKNILSEAQNSQFYINWIVLQNSLFKVGLSKNFERLEERLFWQLSNVLFLLQMHFQEIIITGFGTQLLTLNHGHHTHITVSLSHSSFT